MHLPTPLLLLPLLPLALAQTIQTPCHSIHLLLARGSTEPYPGWLSSLSTTICESLPPSLTCGSQDIIYPATIPDFCDSALQGVVAGHDALGEYVRRCPGSQVVLAGYSQGAQVVGDILGGGGGEMQALGCKQGGSLMMRPEGEVGKAIKAVVLFGDTRHVANQPYNVGKGSSYDGIFPRTGLQKANLNAWAPVLQSYCIFGDPYCARLSQFNPNDTSAHHLYEEKHLDDAVRFVRSKLEVPVM